MRQHGFGVVLALGLMLAGEAKAQDWKAFAAAFPAFPCQDGWMGCLVDGSHVSPDVGKDSEGRAMPSDLRVSWFDLKATATFSPFTALSAYKGAPAVVAAADPTLDPAEDDGAAMVDEPEPERPQPSAESVAAQRRADEAAANADAARASQATADREAKEAAAAQKQAEIEAKKRRDEEAKARREADDLARKAQAAASAAQASERAALEKQAAEAKARADAAAKERLAAEEANRRAREADEAARKKAEEEERKRKEAEATRLAAEESAREKAEADRRRQEELARQEAERKAAEDAKAAALAASQAAAAAAEQDRKAAEAAKAQQAAKTGAPEPAATAGSDGVAEAAVGTPAPAPVDDGSCSDLTKLEPTALLGKLSEGQAGCLEASIAAAPKMTDKKKISLVLQANAWSKGDKNSWEQLVKRHLDEIDQSDPDLCYKYALHLSKMGPGRASGVIRWANVALENRTVWTGDTYTSRVYSLYKVRAAASQALWQDAEGEHAKTPSDESRDKVDKFRNMTKVNAREWYEYARSSGKDASTALQVCISAAGTADYCEAG